MLLATRKPPGIHTRFGAKTKDTPRLPTSDYFRRWTNDLPETGGEASPPAEVKVLPEGPTTFSNYSIDI